jgi:hypothetical protein
VGLHAGLGLAYNVSCTGLEFVAYHLEHCTMYCSAIGSINITGLICPINAPAQVTKQNPFSTTVTFDSPSTAVSPSFPSLNRSTVKSKPIQRPNIQL